MLSSGQSPEQSPQARQVTPLDDAARLSQALAERIVYCFYVHAHGVSTLALLPALERELRESSFERLVFCVEGCGSSLEQRRAIEEQRESFASMTEVEWSTTAERITRLADESDPETHDQVLSVRDLVTVMRGLRTRFGCHVGCKIIDFSDEEGGDLLNQTKAQTTARSVQAANSPLKAPSDIEQAQYLLQIKREVLEATYAELVMFAETSVVREARMQSQLVELVSQSDSKTIFVALVGAAHSPMAALSGASPRIMALSPRDPHIVSREPNAAQEEVLQLRLQSMIRQGGNVTESDLKRFFVESMFRHTLNNLMRQLPSDDRADHSGPVGMTLTVATQLAVLLGPGVDDFFESFFKWNESDEKSPLLSLIAAVRCYERMKPYLPTSGGLTQYDFIVHVRDSLPRTGSACPS